MNRLTLLMCFALTVFAAGCDSSSSKNDDQASTPRPGQPISDELRKAFPDLPTPMQPDGPVQLVYKMQPGDSWRIVFDQKLNMDSMGMAVAETSDAQMTFTCESVQDDRFQVTSSITRLVAGIDTPGGSYRIDTVNPEKAHAAAVFQPMVDIWSEVLKTEARFVVTSAGTFPDIEVPDAITGAVNAHQEAANGFGVTPETLFANFVVGLFEVPATPVEVGHKWEPAVPLPPQGAGEVHADATFLGVAEQEGRRLAVIEMTSRFSAPADNSMFEKFDMRGDAVVLFDLDGGYLWKEYILRTGDFELTVNDRSMEQELAGQALIWRMESED